MRPNKLLSTFLICCLLFAFSWCNAQKYHFKHYNTEDGLNQSQVTSICHGQNGLLYVGTLSGGISIFDGRSFKPFFNDIFTSEHSIWKIISDQEGALWIASDLGLHRYKDGYIQAFSAQNGFVDDAAWSLLEDSHENIWIGTQYNGLFLYDDKTFTHYSLEEGFSIDAVCSLEEDRDGTIWAGSFDRGIACIKDYQVSPIKDTVFSNNSVYDFLLRKDGSFYCSTDQGVWINDKGRWKRPEKMDSALFDLPVWTIEEDRFGQLWIGTQKSGLYMESGDRMINMQDDNGLQTSLLYDLYLDNNGNMWAGLDGAGLALFKGFTFTSYSVTTGLNNRDVLCLNIDKENNIWLGTEKGLNLIRPDGSIRHFSEEDGLAGNLLWSLYRDSFDRLWISGMLGLSVLYNEDSIVDLSSEFDFPIYALCEPTPGELWIGSDDGLLSYNGDSSWYITDGLIANESINYMYKAKDGRIWILCYDRIVIYQNGEFVESIKPEGIYDFQDITEDDNGQYYITYRSGIMVIRKDGSILQLNKDNGLSNNNIYFSRYAHGYLWVGHQSGFDKITLNKDGSVQSKRSFSDTEGFSGIETNDKAFFVANDGAIWFGSIKGAFRYSPENDLPKTTQPVIIINDLKIQYGAIDWRKEYPKLSIKDGLPIDPVFNRRHNHISFDFTGIDFQNSKAIQYQFILEGFDSDWSPLSSQPFASYPYLPPGKYVFKVKCTDGQGNWSSTKSYSFEIEGPFWKKTWFYVLAIPLLGLIIYLLTVWRTRRLSSSKRRLEELIKKRTSELRKNNQELSRLSIVAREIYDAVLICDADGNIEWYNKSFYEMAGYTSIEDFQQSAYGKIKNLKDLSSHGQISSVFEQFKRSEKPYKYDSYHIDKKGKMKWTGSTLTPVYNKKGRLESIIGVYRDITNRKMFEKELQNKNKELKQLSMVAEKMNEAVIITDAEGVIMYYNYSMVRNSGYTDEEFDGIIEEHKTIQNVSSNENIGEIFQNFHVSKDTVLYDSFHEKKDGEKMWTTASLTPVYEGGTLKNVVAVYTDITERRNIALELFQTNKDLTDSIVYAKQIQRAVLPDPQILSDYFEDSFVFYIPKDIVSGDFYWFSYVRGVLVFVAADCTGHGVPGAFMSMIGNEFLHQIVNKSNIEAPHQALERLDKKILRALHQNKNEVQGAKDGMDIALCAIHLEDLKCQFAGAFNPLYLIRDGELIIYDPAKETIGGMLDPNKKFFTHEFSLKKGDCLYVFSDGFKDQFGGEKNKKFTRRRFQNLLLEMQDLPMSEQKQRLNDTFHSWKGDNQQVDDVLVIGLRID